MIRLVREGPVARLLIDRPARRNALDLAMWSRVPTLLAEAEADPGLRLLLLQSAVPGLFSAGADIAELMANRADADWRAANQAAIAATQHALARFPLPTIAFVDGDAIGGGCGLALACDIRVATPRARFGITPAKLGLVYPLHDVKLLVDLVGPGQARRLLYTGALVDAAEALRIGLVEAIADTPDALAAQIVANAASSTRALKGFVARVLDGAGQEDADSRAVFAAAFEGEDFQEGATAFLERRPPRFNDDPPPG